MPVAKNNKKAAPSKPVAKKAPIAKATLTSERPKAPAKSAEKPAAKGAPDTLQSLLDKQAIHELMVDYCRAVDRLDVNLLKSLFHAEGTIDLGHGIFQGAVTPFAEWLLEAFSQYVRATQTCLSNVRIQLRAEQALVESYFVMQQRVEKPGQAEDVFIAGRFLDRVSRKNGVWKIIHRKWVLDWTRTLPVADIFATRNPDTHFAARGLADLSAKLENFPGAPGREPSFPRRPFSADSIKY